ncbi:lipid A deacylase LpxR family protein [Siphonobacter sp. SORGH_AS_0500]|uniref:lipid A deacylase LpxR family protein n=1 Tax=Siphonobacter sp. SORGH_AS_0500 TaxID=1864824 RepID=UPI00285810A9|nr:lipid A deacylase LpxR family protein [Siphonobacter sp. SORGH_AS_0500]MDR6193946.1 lipid A 3-O-deacylase [Siphonobacter sp. SORGH_AS_0500]
MPSAFLRFVFLWFGLLLPQLLLAQSHELKVTSENDAYLWNRHDGYYTNGIFASFHYLPSKLNNRLDSTRKVTKITSTYQIGQMIYNPENVFLVTTRQIDRPYTGYLYAQKGFSFFYRKNQVLNVSASLGFTGKHSYAKQIQTLIHKTFNFIPPEGWVKQLNSEFSLNLRGQYFHSLLPPKRQRWLEVFTSAQVELGTPFTSASAGLLFQLGLFQKASESSLFNAQISRNSDHQKPEIYFFFHPQLRYQLYNSTIQGGLFLQDKGPATGPITPFVYLHQLGITAAFHRLTLSSTFSYTQREARLMREKAEHYGGFAIAYRFN